MSKVVPLSFNVAGVTFDGRQNILWSLRERDITHPGSVTLQFKRETNNEHDPNAIQTCAHIRRPRGKTSEYPIGYVPREIAEKIAPLIDSGATLQCDDFTIVGGRRDHNLGCVTHNHLSI